MLLSLAPIAGRRPEYSQWSILLRMIEPERQIIFRVPWVDDEGRAHVNRGYRVRTRSEPKGCRECGQPVEVVSKVYQPSGAKGETLERRCFNPTCPINTHPNSASQRP